MLRGGRGRRFSELAERRFERRRELAGGACAPVVEEEDRRLRIGHVMVNGDDAETVLAQSLEDARLHNQAQQLVEQGHYAEAEQLYKRLLAINEQALGPDHNTVATVLNNLGVLYYHQGRYAEAEPLYKRSLAISEKHFGREHPALQDSVTKLPQPKF